MELMSEGKFKGSFSASLLSLQLQLKTLLEEAGGEVAVQFLNAVSNLHQTEQNTVLPIFTSIVEKISKGEERFATDGDLARKQFEDGLYNDILSAMREATEATCVKKFTVVNGGKAQEVVRKVPVNLNEVRKNRKGVHKPFLN